MSALQPRLLTVLRKITICKNCGEPFEQNTSARKRICPDCRAVSTKGGAR